MKFTMTGFETVEINENEIRWLSEGLETLIAYLEKSYLFDDRDDVLKMHNDLLDKIAKVAGYGKSIMG